MCVQEQTYKPILVIVCMDVMTLSHAWNNVMKFYIKATLSLAVSHCHVLCEIPKWTPSLNAEPAGVPIWQRENMKLKNVFALWFT